MKLYIIQPKLKIMVTPLYKTVGGAGGSSSLYQCERDGTLFFFLLRKVQSRHEASEGSGGRGTEIIILMLKFNSIVLNSSDNLIVVII